MYKWPIFPELLYIRPVYQSELLLQQVSKLNVLPTHSFKPLDELTNMRVLTEVCIMLSRDKQSLEFTLTRLFMEIFLHRFSHCGNRMPT